MPATSGAGNRKRHPTKSAKFAFVLMPFKPALTEVYQLVVKPAVERVTGFRCMRADDIYGPTAIMADVWKAIVDSKIVIADLTDRNPNVFYELGLAHAMGKPVVMISQSLDDVPFDLRHLRVLLYTNTDSGRKGLEGQLWDTLGVLLNDLQDPQRVSRYRVFETPHSGRRETDADLSAVDRIRSDKSITIIEALHNVVAEYKNKRKPTGCDPEVLAAIIDRLQSTLLDVQLAAVRAIGAAGDRIHAPYLYPILDSDNPVLLQECLATLGALKDNTVLPRLWSMYKQPRYANFRSDILRAAGRLDYYASNFLYEVAHNAREREHERDLAIYLLGEIGDNILLKFGPDEVRSLSPKLRASFAEAIGKLEVSFQVDIVKVDNILRVLCEDNCEEVRAGALGSWCWQSSHGHKLSRPYLWARLDQETPTVIELFLANVGEGEPFAEHEVPDLLRLVERNEFLKHDLIYFLKDIGDPSVAKLMLEACSDERSDLDVTWAMVYFSRIPIPEALDTLRREFARVSDPARRVLSAMALAKLGYGDALEVVPKLISSTPRWVIDHVAVHLRNWIDANPEHSLRKSMVRVLKSIE